MKAGVCASCGGLTIESCDRCQQPVCVDCARAGDAGYWCEACVDGLTAESLAECGGEQLLRAEARLERERRAWAREARFGWDS